MNNMQRQASPARKPEDTNIDFNDLISMHKALLEVLAEETEHMKAMRLEQVGALQEKKLKLTQLLQRTSITLKKKPELLTQITAAQKEELKGLTEKLQTVMKTNYDTLLVARSVNSVVVKAVTKAAIKERHNPTYNARGKNDKHQHQLVSFSLNHTA